MKKISLSTIITLCLISTIHAETMNNAVPGTSTGVTNNPNIIMNPNAPVYEFNSSTNPVAPAGVMNTNDADIAVAVQSMISQNAGFAGAAIRVTCQQGYITLEGAVKSMAQVTQAINIARSVKGVLGVNNRLTILPNPNYPY